MWKYLTLVEPFSEIVSHTLSYSEDCLGRRHDKLEFPNDGILETRATRYDLISGLGNSARRWKRLRVYINK